MAGELQVTARYARALAHIVAVLGPELCHCDLPADCGLPDEAGEALRVAKAALAGEEF